jgi:hypothetical protein
MGAGIRKKRIFLKEISDHSVQKLIEERRVRIAQRG